MSQDFDRCINCWNRFLTGTDAIHQSYSCVHIYIHLLAYLPEQGSTSIPLYPGRELTKMFISHRSYRGSIDIQKFVTCGVNAAMRLVLRRLLSQCFGALASCVLFYWLIITSLQHEQGAIPGVHRGSSGYVGIPALARVLLYSD